MEGNYYDKNREQVVENLYRKLKRFDENLSRLKVADRIIADVLAEDASSRNLSKEENKLTPLDLLRATKNEYIWTKIMETYLPNLASRIDYCRHPPSAFDIITPFDEEAKRKLDDWILKLLDGPELYHILGLIKLPITISIPSDIHRLENLMPFQLFSESSGKYTTIPGFMSKSDPDYRILASLRALGMSAHCVSPVSPDYSIKLDQNQYRTMFENDSIAPTLLFRTSLLFSPTSDRSCFSFAHSSLNSQPIRSIISIPAYNGQFGIWKPSKELQTTSTSVKIELDREEIELILICDAVQSYYKKLREEYIGPNKPGAFQLLKDWMSFALPEEGREQALYLTNYAIARSLIYSAQSWPNNYNSSWMQSVLEIYLPNQFHTSWPHLVGYFQQLVHTYNVEGIPHQFKSLVFSHFKRIMNQEKDTLRQTLKGGDPWTFEAQDTQNLAHTLALFDLRLQHAGLDMLFGLFFAALLVGKIQGVYFQHTGLLTNTLREVTNDGRLSLNIKPGIIGNPTTSESQVDGLMNILYDINNPSAPCKSKFFDKVTKDNSINIHFL